MDTIEITVQPDFIVTSPQANLDECDGSTQAVSITMSDNIQSYTINGGIAGGVAIRKLDSKVCEMKRLFVYSSSQGKGLGEVLCNKIISIAREVGYCKMRLDTVSKLKSAIGLYKKIGFYQIEAYCPNPDPTVKYMELEI